MSRLYATGRADQVGCHVVSRTKSRVQDKGSTRYQGGNLFKGDERVPQCKSVTNGVESSPASTTCELREIGWFKNLMSLTVVFGDFVEHNGASRHVDSYSKRFGGEHHLHETLCEAFFNGFLKAWYKARMMHTYSRL